MITVTPLWIASGSFALSALIVHFFGSGTSHPAKKRVSATIVFAFLVAFVLYGSMAQGVTFMTRADGAELFFGFALVPTITFSFVIYAACAVLQLSRSKTSAVVMLTISWGTLLTIASSEVDQAIRTWYFSIAAVAGVLSAVVLCINGVPRYTGYPMFVRAFALLYIVLYHTAWALGQPGYLVATCEVTTWTLAMLDAFLQIVLACGLVWAPSSVHVYGLGASRKKRAMQSDSDSDSASDSESDEEMQSRSGSRRRRRQRNVPRGSAQGASGGGIRTRRHGHGHATESVIYDGNGSVISREKSVVIMGTRGETGEFDGLTDDVLEGARDGRITYSELDV